MAKKYTKTAAENSSEALALKKIDELVDAYASLKASFDALVSKLNADHTSMNAAVTGSNLDTNYSNASAKAAPSKTSEELI
jgi:hypothetical protein